MGPSVGRTSRSTRTVTCTSARRTRSSRRRASWSMMGRHFSIGQKPATVVVACSRHNAVQRRPSAKSRAVSTRKLATLPTRGIGKSVHSPDQAAFCELMIGARKAAGLTQHALARRLNKPQSFVAKYEGGERRLDVVEFITIARALEVDPLKLMTMLLSGGKGKSARAKRNT